MAKEEMSLKKAYYVLVNHGLKLCFDVVNEALHGMDVEKMKELNDVATAINVVTDYIDETNAINE